MNNKIEIEITKEGLLGLASEGLEQMTLECDVIKACHEENLKDPSKSIENLGRALKFVNNLAHLANVYVHVAHYFQLKAAEEGEVFYDLAEIMKYSKR